MPDIISTAGQILAYLGGGAVIILGLSNWIGTMWAKRFEAANQSKYAKELEAERSTYAIELEAERSKYTRELESLKASLERSSADRTRKLEGLMHHYERQVEEFYGPLFSLINQQMFVAHDVQNALVDRVSPEQAGTIREYYQTNYFIPMHNEIQNILKTKLYLIEGTKIPASIDKYLRHVIQERDQRTLWQKYHISTDSLEGVRYPQELYGDIEAGLQTAMKNYEQCIEGLKS